MCHVTIFNFRKNTRQIYLQMGGSNNKTKTVTHDYTVVYFISQKSQYGLSIKRLLEMAHA